MTTLLLGATGTIGPHIASSVLSAELSKRDPAARRYENRCVNVDLAAPSGIAMDVASPYSLGEVRRK